MTLPESEWLTMGRFKSNAPRARLIHTTMKVETRAFDKQVLRNVAGFRIYTPEGQNIGELRAELARKFCRERGWAWTEEG